MTLFQLKGVWKIKILQMNHNEQSGCLGTVSPLNHKSILLEKNKIDALETESGYKVDRK